MISNLYLKKNLPKQRTVKIMEIKKVFYEKVMLTALIG